MKLKLNLSGFLLFIGLLSYGQDSLVQILVEKKVISISDITVVRKTSLSSNASDFISKQDQELFNPQTSADVLQLSPEVFLQKSQLGGGSPMVRGLSTNRLLYSLDGVRLNHAIYRSGNLHNVLSIDPFTVEHMNLYMGSGNTLFSGDAMGGVFRFRSTNFLSADTGFTSEGNLFARLSTANNERSNHFSFKMAKGKWSSISSISYQHYGDQTMGSIGTDDYLQKFLVLRINDQDSLIHNPNALNQVPTGYNQFNLMQKTRYELNNRTKIRHDIHYSTTSHIGRYDRLQRTSQLAPLYAQWDYGPQQWVLNRISIENTGKTRLFDGFNLIGAHQHYQESRITRRFNSDTQRHQQEQVNAYSINANFFLHKNKNSFTCGLESIYNDVNSSGSTYNLTSQSTQLSAARYPLSSWTNAGVFFDWRRDIRDSVILEAGIRQNLTHLNADFTQQSNYYPVAFSQKSNAYHGTTGYLGLIAVRKHNLFQINTGTAYRAPNVDDLGKLFDFQDQQVVVPNDNLQAERSYSVDVSHRFSREGFSLKTQGFARLIDNAFARRKTEINGADSIVFDGALSEVYNLQNTNHSIIYGANITMSIRWKTLEFNSSINWQEGTDYTDSTKSPSRYTPPLYAYTSLSYSRERLKIILYHLYNAGFTTDELNVEELQKADNYARDAAGAPYVPSWQTLNAKFVFVANVHLSLSGGVENIFDLRYRPYASGISSSGRNFIIAGKINF